MKHSWVTENTQSILYTGDGLPVNSTLRLVLGGHTKNYIPVYYMHYTDPDGTVIHHMRNTVAPSKGTHRTQWTLEFAKKNAQKWIEENFDDNTSNLS